MTAQEAGLKKKKKKIKKGSERCRETKVNPMEAVLLLKISDMR